FPRADADADARRPDGGWPLREARTLVHPRDEGERTRARVSLSPRVDRGRRIGVLGHRVLGDTGRWPRLLRAVGDRRRARRRGDPPRGRRRAGAVAVTTAPPPTRVALCT